MACPRPQTTRTSTRLSSARASWEANGSSSSSHCSYCLNGISISTSVLVSVHARVSVGVSVSVRVSVGVSSALAPRIPLASVNIALVAIIVRFRTLIRPC